MTVDPDTVAERITLFQQAQDLVDPVIEKHGLKEYRTGQAVSTASVYSTVEQHINHIVDVAKWLGALDD